MEPNTAMTDATQQYSLGGFGARLAEARKSIHLSRKDAATRLHLNPNILEYIETENFEHAPPLTFMRGYLRSYARLLNVADEEVNAALTQAGLNAKPSTFVAPVLPTPKTSQFVDRYVQWISTSVVVGLFVFVGIWWGFHSRSANDTVTAANTTSTTQPLQVVIQQTATSPTQQSAASTATPAVATSQPVPQQSATVASTAPTTQQPTTTTAPNTTAMPIPQPATPPGAVQLNRAAPVIAANAVVSGMQAIPTITAPIPKTSTSRKHTRHHQQDNNVSGFAMALPEPGL